MTKFRILILNTVRVYMYQYKIYNFVYLVCITF